MSIASVLPGLLTPMTIGEPVALLGVPKMASAALEEEVPESLLLLLLLLHPAITIGRAARPMSIARVERWRLRKSGIRLKPFT